MNGIALLLITATLGVEYTWRMTDDSQIEYVVIVEQDHISASLAQGDQISSSVPTELESLQRLCIRIAQPATKNGIAPPPTVERRLPVDAFRNTRIGLRAAEPLTLLWKATSPQPEETTLVRYGWQPTKEGQLEYFVQIDPKLLRTLAPGDEIYATLAPEAGQIDTFVVFSNAKQLPKVPGKPLAAPASTSLAKTTAPGSAFAPTFAPIPPATTPPAAPNAFNAPPLSPAPGTTTFGPPSTGFNSPAATTTGFNDKPFAQPRSFGVNDDPLNDPAASRVNPATNYGPASPASPTDSVRGFNWENSSRPDATRPDMTRPNLNAPGVNTTGLNNGGLNNSHNPSYRSEPYTTPNSNYPSASVTQSPGYNYPGSSFANNPNGGGTGYASNPNNGYGNNPNNGALRPGAPLPTAGNAPYRPGVGGYPQDNNVAANGYNAPNMNNPNPPLPPNYVQAPQAVDYRPLTGENQVASLPNNAMRPGQPNDFKNGLAGTTNGPVVPVEKPWWTLIFVSFFAMISFGANLYLGWTAAEFYSRYRLAVERLRTSGPRA